MDNQNFRNRSRDGNSRLPKIEPWLSFIGGGALTAFGISRKSLGGVALAAAGGYLIYRAASSLKLPRAFTCSAP